ncbi:MAG TPA: SDR family NAD(P)-dependent oxidoreductase [Byssovorax sp.]|jgi:short-subunit dehydrogenase
MAEHVFVTGASGAIGGAIARELRRRRPAIALSLVDVTEEPSRDLAVELGGDAGFVRADLSSSTDAARALDDAIAARGPVSGLVNCAGIMEVRRFERIDWARADALLAIDLVSPLRLMHAAVPAMIARAATGDRASFVVNVASMAGRVTLPGCAFYGAAKAGLAMASEIAHAELAPRGVHVVTVYPGPVRSALEARARAQYERGLVSRLAPAGDPGVLARKIVDAIDGRRARVVYPSVYAVGLLAITSPIALAVGPAAAD